MGNIIMANDVTLFIAFFNAYIHSSVVSKTSVDYVHYFRHVSDKLEIGETSILLQNNNIMTVILRNP